MLWDIGSDEVRQGLARSLFSSVSYNLDTQWIVNFRLKPWADRFIMLRADLYEDETGEKEKPEDESSGSLTEGTQVPHSGLGFPSVPSLEEAVQRILSLVYAHTPLPSQPISGREPPKTERNLEVARLYSLGVSVPELAKHFGISVQRVYQILKSTPKHK